MLPGTNFFSQSITYAPYTNSSIHALLSGTYGNRNGCFSYWHSYRFKHDNFPQSKILSETVIFLPLFPALKDKEVAYIIRTITNIWEKY